MDNPDEDRIIVNVKGVRKTSWEEAKRLSMKHGEPLGETLSRLIDQAARSDTAPREVLTMADFGDANLPSKTANPEIDRLALLTAVTALSAATQRKIPGATTFAAEMIREARGLPPLPPRLTGPKRGKVAATNGHDQITEDTHK